jgi:hypothetical protein
LSFVLVEQYNFSRLEDLPESVVLVASVEVQNEDWVKDMSVIWQDRVKSRSGLAGHFSDEGLALTT